MNRQDAIAAGEYFYFGKPCKFGHCDENNLNKRITGSGGCVICQHELSRSNGLNQKAYERHKGYQRKNNQTEHRKAYMRAYMKQYWIDHPRGK